MKLMTRKGVYYITHKGQRISLYTTEKKTAERIFVSVVGKITLARLGLSSENRKRRTKSASKPVSDVFEAYYKQMKLKGVTEDTLSFKRRMIKVVLSSGIKYFSDICQETVNRFAEQISGLSQDTRRKYITDLMAFLNDSRRKGYLSEDVLKRVDLPKYRSRVRDLIITDDDWKKVLEYTKSHDLNFYFYLLTLFNTFSRPNEVRKLKGSDFHLSERYIDIWQNKTQKTKRVYLFKSFCDEISALAAAKKDDYMFDNPTGAGNCYAKKWVKLREKLGLNDKYALYTVRHTSITYLMNVTHDVEFVARQAGNNPSMTMKHYINRDEKHCLAMLDGEKK